MTTNIKSILEDLERFKDAVKCVFNPLSHERHRGKKVLFGKIDPEDMKAEISKEGEGILDFSSFLISNVDRSKYYSNRWKITDAKDNIEISDEDLNFWETIAEKAKPRNIENLFSDQMFIVGKPFQKWNPDEKQKMRQNKHSIVMCDRQKKNWYRFDFENNRIWHYYERFEIA